MFAAAFRRLVLRGPPALWQDGLEQAAAGGLSRFAPAVQQLQISPWWQGPGFASAAGSGGGGSNSGGSNDSARPAASGGQKLEEGNEEQQRRQQQNPDNPTQQQQAGMHARLEEQQGQSKAQQRGPSGAAPGEQAAAAAAGSGRAGSADREPPTFGEAHPELKKYIDQLKQLKGGWWRAGPNLSLARFSARACPAKAPERCRTAPLDSIEAWSAEHCAAAPRSHAPHPIPHTPRRRLHHRAAAAGGRAPHLVAAPDQPHPGLLAAARHRVSLPAHANRCCAAADLT